MKRKIISIDENLCNGCGLCVSACHEGALQLVGGKAKLVSDSYCDGLGACLPKCPTDAIKIVEREADAFDEAAVAAKQAAAKIIPTAHVSAPSASPRETPAAQPPPLACGCPGKMAKTLTRPGGPASVRAADGTEAVPPGSALESRLVNWPVQIKLVPVNAPYLKNAALLIAADCTAFAYPDIHSRFMTNKVTLIGCPKLDEGDYAEKLTAILQANDIRSVTVLRMEVPCCAGIAHAAQRALMASGKMIPWHVVTISTDGAILDE
jgi:Pyruvate/2-oxoacid:ferredoxin oxidoreductase delta subunit